MSDDIIKKTFTVCMMDKIYLKSYGISVNEYRKCTKKILDILFSLEELKTSKIFKSRATRIRFDIAFCKNRTIQDINRDYRNKDVPTDVITFALFNDDKNSIVYRKTAELGQIVISVEMANKQKVSNNNTFKQEILTLTIHGILHLMGFDHLTKKDYDFVVNIQNKVLKEFNE